jgi:hypothetical protein
MKIWALRCAGIDDYSVVVPASEQDLLDGVLDIDLSLSMLHRL